MTKSIALLVIVSLGTSACSYLRSNQPKPGDQAALAAAMQTETSDVKTEQLMKKPGLIHIERHTPEYSISLVLDASDDNIYFEMDLPENQQKPQDKTAESENTAQQGEKQAMPGRDEQVTNTRETRQEQLAAPRDQQAREFAPTEDSSSASTKHVLYAQTYFFEKKYNRALSEVNRAIEYKPDSAVAYSLQGSILYKLKKKTQAKESWEKALALDPNIDNVENMLKKIKEDE